MNRLVVVIVAAAAACTAVEPAATTPPEETWACVVVDDVAAGAPDSVPDFLERVGCAADFEALASAPIDVTLPGARSVKVGLDRADDDALWLQHSVRFPIHHAFAQAHRSGGALPVVADLGTFNTIEYFSPERRFVLAAVTHYEGPDVWALELSPYDTASAELITKLYDAVDDATFFGPLLRFHPTSEAVALEAARLSGIPLVTTDELYAGTDLQPLSLGTGVGRLRFERAIDLEELYLAPDDIVVLDQAPNDISVVQGLITEEFQTPLSHVNVLAQNRGTPNMGLRGAMTDPALRALEGALIELVVTSSSYTVRAVTQAEADAFAAAHRPPPVVLPALDLSFDRIVDIEEVTPEPNDSEGLRDAIREAARAFGGKAAQYAILARTDDVPVKRAFAIPVFFYDQFMRDNGFYERVATLLDDESFRTDATARDQRLLALREDMLNAPLDITFQDQLMNKIARDFSDPDEGTQLRFRTSTNSEDLDGFPCAGCYESHTADPRDWDDVTNAIKETWSTVWLFRTFEERSFYGVEHTAVGMALLVHANFPDEEANGVAVTNNPFDPSGLSPAFYVNVQRGGAAEVVHPPPGVSSDQLLSYFALPNQPTAFITHSNLVDDGETVLTPRQLHDLGTALQAIHERFSPAYGPAAGNNGWYAMDIEFKFDDQATPGSPTLYVKQARPYPDPVGGVE
jgi:hypothetical protein